MDTLKAVVVGAGGISNAWFPPLIKEGVGIPAVVDIIPDAAEARIKQYNLAAKAFSDVRTALRKTKPDFVVDLTIPAAHCTVTCTALKKGCHVIGEKPMAASLAEARRMVKAAEKAGKLYMVSQSRRWSAEHASLARAAREGAIGDITTINCDFYIGAHFGGFRDEMASPLILDMAIHHFDLARYFTGCDPVAVYAREFNPRGSWYKGDVAASCIFEMTNGVIFTYRGSWCAEGCHTSWNGDWRVIGSSGTLLYEKDQRPTGQVVAGTDGFHRPLAPAVIPDAAMPSTGMHGALCEMLNYLRTGTLPQTDCKDNIKSLAMVFAAIESARKGKRIKITI
jgi:predicted dehydrogenase